MINSRIPAAVMTVLFLASVIVFTSLYIGTDVFRVPGDAHADAHAGAYNDYHGPEGPGRPEDNSFDAENTAASPLFPSGTITLTDETFTQIYDELYNRKDFYYGREIDISGFTVYQEAEGVKSLLIGRDLVWCCADDMYYIGFLVLTDLPYPKENTPVRIKGKIKPAEYTSPDDGRSFTVPAVKADSITAAENISRRVYPVFTGR